MQVGAQPRANLVPDGPRCQNLSAGQAHVLRNGQRGRSQNRRRVASDAAQIVEIVGVPDRAVRESSRGARRTDVGGDDSSLGIAALILGKVDNLASDFRYRAQDGRAQIIQDGLLGLVVRLRRDVFVWSVHDPFGDSFSRAH